MEIISKTYLSLSKSVCQNCGTINSVDGINAYSCGKDVYSLNPCDSNFFLDFDNTTYTAIDSRTHTATLKAGQYCQFCKGTYTQAKEETETIVFTKLLTENLVISVFTLQLIARTADIRKTNTRRQSLLYKAIMARLTENLIP